MTTATVAGAFGRQMRHPAFTPGVVGLLMASALLIVPSPDFSRREPYALAAWNMVFAAIELLALRLLFRAIDGNERRALGAAALAITCPLFWFAGMRAIGDMSALVVASAAQALIATALRQDQPHRVRPTTWLLAGACLAGIAIGFRPQTSWLTLPLLGLVTIHHTRQSKRLIALYVAASALVGYLAALTQVIGVDTTRTLGATPDFSLAIDAIVRMIAYPWSNGYLAFAIAGLGVIGVVGLMRHSRRPVMLFLLCFAPYAIFQLLSHDRSLISLALPVVPAMAYLSIRGLDMIAGRQMVWGACALVLVSLSFAVPPVVRHARVGGPSFQAMDAVRDAQARATTGPTLAMHHAVHEMLGLTRLPPSTLDAPANYEWLELVRYWNNGGTAPVWFLAEPERADLALIDPQARRLRGSYRLPFDGRFFTSGIRPAAVDWYEIDSPSWYAGEGWALTAESARVADADGRGPDRAPITAYVRRRTAAAVLIVGGRHLDPAAKPARFHLSIGGRRIDSWVVTPKPGSFLRLVPLPAGSLEGSDESGQYLPLQIHSVAIDGSRQRTRTSITQFDVQSADRAVFGFGTGWYDQERDSNTLRSWRWMGPVAGLRIHPGGRDVSLHLSGDAPLDLLEQPATLIIHAGEWIVGRIKVAGEFTERIHVPAAALAASKGVLTIASDRSFVPSVALRNGDRRVLALQVFEVRIEPELSTVTNARGIEASVVR